jgi:hypothetical protein
MKYIDGKGNARFFGYIQIMHRTISGLSKMRTAKIAHRMMRKCILRTDDLRTM